MTILERLASAQMGSVELDIDIALSQGWKLRGGAPGAWYAPDHKLHNTPPRFTTSLDAALTLVPEEMEWLVDLTISHGKKYYSATVGPLCVEVYAATPELALSSAALRARNTEGE